MLTQYLLTDGCRGADSDMRPYWSECIYITLVSIYLYPRIQLLI